MRHTYFYDSLEWAAEGTYYDEEERQFPLHGEVRIVHEEKVWSLNGFMEVCFDKPVRFTNDYEIKESERQHTLTWESQNPALGTLKGAFEIVGDSIISHYHSADGVYAGTETLVQLEATKYYNAGVSFCNGQKMSSWTAAITARGGESWQSQT